MLILASLILRSLLFLITNCCALLKAVQNKHVLWICISDTPHYRYHYFMSIMCFFVHKCYYSNLALPTIFKNYFHTNNIIHVYGTRSYDMLHLFTVNSSFGTKCIKFKGCLLWNNLPRSITNINSHVVFRKKLKYYLCESMSL